MLSNRMQWTVGICGMIFVMMIAGNAQAEIVAKVNGIGVSSDRIDEWIRTLPDQERQRARTPEGMQIVLQQVIAEEVMYHEAQRNHIDRLTSVLDRIEQTRRQTMVGELANQMLREQGGIEAVRTHYNAHKQAYKRVRASHILTETIEDLEEARAMLDQGMDFAALAKKVSKDPSAATNGGDLGLFTHQMMVPEFADAAFAMKINELKGPVKTRYGYHLIKLVDIQLPGDFDALEEKERQLIRRELFQKRLDELHIQADIEVFDDAVSKYIDGPKQSGANEMDFEDTSHNE